MKNFKSYLTVLIITFVSINYSCKKEDVDNTKPTISINTPVDDALLHVGDKIDFDCVFSDDVELKSYKIEIHYNADGHTHTKVLAEAVNPWVYNNSWDFDKGTKNITVRHNEIEIPEIFSGAEIDHGDYHFGVFCSDVAGNETSVFIDIEIEGDHSK